MSTLLAFVSVLLAATPGASQAPYSRAVEQGVSHGFKDCAPALDRYVRSIEKDDTDYAHVGIWDKGSPNRHAFHTITSDRSGNNVAITAFSAAKNVAGGCDVAAIQILHVSMTCAEFRETVGKKWRFYSALGGSSAYKSPDSDGVMVILSDVSGGHCLLVKQTLEFNG
ncbi:MAG: hypothetical protein Q8Q88_21475 [Phenylobacterium sp.]|uniref:hypothetical protein n=1 Tax=Phenylobacterium sp. TaxID=1871053 RepID=UPI002735AA9C|nr:hypothetical protein [Phenylobacterium sp.]MDP3749610.1 hypothetical protein [Phenylobacterium sp.]